MKDRRIPVNEYVKNTVDDVAQRSRQDKAYAIDRAPVVAIFERIMHTVSQHPRRHQSEDRQKKLAVFPGKLQPVSHPVILGKMDEEEIAQNLELLSQV